MWKRCFLLVLLLTGCVASSWTKSGGMFTEGDLVLSIPDGWMMKEGDHSLMITKDGMPLQRIWIFDVEINKLAGEGTKTVKTNMLPQEAAEFVVDILQSDKNLSQFALLENKPATVNGNKGFRLVYTYKERNLPYKSVYYGFLYGERFLRISYNAPVRHYFDKDVDVFETIVNSLRPKKQQTSSARSRPIPHGSTTPPGPGMRSSPTTSSPSIR